jgi:hypothetical protein
VFGFIAQIEICTGMELKPANPTIGFFLRGEITESTPVADVVCLRHKLTSEKMKLSGNDLP